MQLRIYRNWRWVPVEVDPSRIVFGAKPVLKLIANDELQQMRNGEWRSIPIVEGPKPEHPDLVKQCEETIALRETIKNIADNFRVNHQTEGGK